MGEAADADSRDTSRERSPAEHCDVHGTASATGLGYQRSRDLPRLIALWPEELISEDPASRRAIVRKLHGALRAERRRGLAGHWTYDLSRHSQLLAAYRSELEALKAASPRGYARAFKDKSDR